MGTFASRVAPNQLILHSMRRTGVLQFTRDVISTESPMRSVPGAPLPGTRAFITLVTLMAVALVGSLAWGFMLDRQAKPTHIPPSVALPADSAWYSALPMDPDAATEKFLARLPPDSRARSDAYGSALNRIIPLIPVATILAALLLLYSRTADRVERVLAHRKSHRAVQLMCVIGTTHLVIWLLTFPIGTYATFVLPRRAGLVYGTFADDIGWRILGEFIGRLLLVGLATAVYMVSRDSARRGVSTLAVVYLVWSTFNTAIFPPISNRYIEEAIPLSSASITSSTPMIQAFAKANGIPDRVLWVQSVGEREGRYNAGVSGIRPFSNILFDEDIMRGLTDDEVRFIIGHEFAHWKENHVPAHLALTLAVTFIVILLVVKTAGSIIARFGQHWGITHVMDVRAFPLLLAVYVLLQTATTPLLNTYRRSQEARADWYALEITRKPNAMANYLVRGGEDAEVHPSAVNEFLFSDHPSIYSRVRAAMRWRAAHAH